MTTAPLILLAAGGTGGHLFPAEALGAELIRRGLRVRLATDSRALRYSGLFSRDTIDVVPSETVRSRAPWSLAYTGVMLAAGTAVSLNLMRRLKPAAVVGFGGYPTLPPLLAARMFGVPGIIHEANAVLGRANRFLSNRVNAIATSLPGVLDRDPALSGKTTTVGTPMRPAILAAAAVKFVSPEPAGQLRLLVVGGSQGARVMADIVPGAIERLEPALWNRLVLTQQVREEDMARVRAVYDRLKINAELAPAPWPNSAPSAARRSWCRCPVRSTRISSPMPVCWRKPMARFGFRKEILRPTGWPRRSPRSPPSLSG
jgi:UDP-N-acetylglucosamine--N-acetylmuramyl-(pentapeptide) pyrophosphoryl-undecaprenol N-acetylglucosamine transferase